ncbi:MAG TPA: YajG family lipoprotein [Sedimentisphaerales bacterium]|nr:YajG family lipoprotein [Sedimentisphaerales bacterium]
MRTLLVILLVAFVLLLTGCGIVAIDVSYTPSGAHPYAMNGSPKVNLQVKDVREKKVFFRTVLGDNPDSGKIGVLRLARPPAETFEEGFIETLQAAGCQVREDTDIIYEVEIKRFLAIDMQKSPHFLDSDIMLEVVVKRSEVLFAKKTIFEKDKEKQVFGQVWQDTVPPLLTRSLSRAIEQAAWDPDIIAAIEQANDLATTAADVLTRKQLAPPKPPMRSPTLSRSAPTTPKIPTTSFDRSSQSPFQSRYVRGLGPPEVFIKNQSSKNISINLTGPEEYSFILPPNDSIKKTIIAGSYSYRASAIGVQGCSGVETFDKDHRYTWTFMIVSYPITLPNIRIPTR